MATTCTKYVNGSSDPSRWVCVEQILSRYNYGTVGILVFFEIPCLICLNFAYFLHQLPLNMF